jgi:hypothetical protein
MIALCYCVDVIYKSERGGERGRRGGLFNVGGGLKLMLSFIQESILFYVSAMQIS